MGKGATTREAIVSQALDRAVQVGLSGLSLGPLADDLNLSKSGLFAHFKSKETLQLAVLQEAINRFTARVVEPGLRTPRGRARMELLIHRWFDWIEGEPGMRGCLFSVAAQEYDDRPGAIHDLLVGSQLQWQETLARMAADLPRGGPLPADMCQQVAFEVTGSVLAFQQQTKLFKAPKARAWAETAVARILDDAANAV
ncbi:TetR/AcrR family transcriptional regulator [Phenylobacterium sp.]|uniref:TetR/AcrR family transcriptional regulator n=1 Tax=Phenylobacterium sp. TaxID=1871053 RepID=UPI0027173389|nr:TetR/AcrR family transcriptional regulator [Phenylobacterium sp.]MDO8801958.1 TetR/AcrR family transcriptional regulator [Phenylobacterium sp.]